MRRSFLRSKYRSYPHLFHIRDCFEMLDRVICIERDLRLVAVKELFLDVVEILADGVEFRMPQNGLKIDAVTVPYILSAARVRLGGGDVARFGSLCGERQLCAYRIGHQRDVVRVPD